MDNLFNLEARVTELERQNLFLLEMLVKQTEINSIVESELEKIQRCVIKVNDRSNENTEHLLELVNTLLLAFGED